MSSAPPKGGDGDRTPVRLERVQAPWWRGGGWRLRRERARTALPIWARAGLRLPGWTLAALSFACALAGGLALALLFAPDAGR